MTSTISRARLMQTKKVYRYTATTIFAALVFGRPRIAIASPVAPPQSLIVSEDDPYPIERWIYSQAPASSQPAVSAALMEAKRLELAGKWQACASAAGRARTLSKTLLPWIDALELRCALAGGAVAPSLKELARAVASVDARPDELTTGPHVALLRSLYAQAAIALMEQSLKSDRARGWAAFDRLEKIRAWLDDKQRARSLRLAGELSFAQQHLEAARAYFQRSLALQEQPELRARLLQLEPPLEKASRGKPASAPISAAPVEASPDEASAAGASGDRTLESTPKESELVERISAALLRGELSVAAVDASSLLKQFPGGTRAKWASDRLFESYASTAEKDDADHVAVRNQIITRMMDCDGDRKTEWAKSMHARGFYDDALRLARSAADSTRGSAREGRALEISMAAAMASEKWRDVRDSAQALIERHAGTSGGREAYLRAGQAAYRMKDYGACVAQLERLLVLPQTDTFELVARHLLWRALQKTSSLRANDQRETLIVRFPFSYYGLRARADRDGAVAGPWLQSMGADATPDKTKLVEVEWLSGVAKAGRDRAMALLRAGWLEEAQAEIRDLPAPLGASAKALRSQLHAAALDYVFASKLINDAWDADPKLRRAPFLRVGFPLEFMTSVEKESKARGLDKWLALGLIKQESGFNARAQSTSNAMGLMQMIPPTAREIASDLKIEGLEIPRDLFLPPLNVRMGTYYLAKTLKHFQGHVPLALAGYNAGPGRMDRWLRARPSLARLAQNRSSAPDDELWFDELPWSETCFYVKAILRNLIMYRVLDQGRVEFADPIWPIVKRERD